MANPHRSSLPPFSPFPRLHYGLLMLTPSLGRTALVVVGRRTTELLHRAAMNVGELPLVAPPSHHLPLSMRMDE